MKGGKCNAQRPPLKSPRQHNIVSHMVMNAGYWPSPGHNNVTHLVRCSEKIGASRYVDTSCNPKGTNCTCEWKEEIKSTICNSHACVQKEARGDFARFVRKIITKREFVAIIVPIVGISVSTS